MRLTRARARARPPPALQHSVREDIIVVCHAAGMKPADVLAAARAAHNKCGHVPLRSVAIWGSFPQDDAGAPPRALSDGMRRLR